ncbi:unnamed protein product, partial [Prorocentrum cordatum]
GQPGTERGPRRAEQPCAPRGARTARDARCQGQQEKKTSGAAGRQHATKNLHKHDPSGARQRRRRRGGAAPMQEIHADLRKSGLTQTTSRREGSC